MSLQYSDREVIEMDQLVIQTGVKNAVCKFMVCIRIFHLED